MTFYLLEKPCFERVKRINPQLIQKLSRILEKNPADTECEEFDAATVKFLEDTMHQGTVSGNLFFLMNSFLDEPYKNLPETLLPTYLLNEIIAHKDEINQNVIRKCK